MNFLKNTLFAFLFLATHPVLTAQNIDVGSIWHYNESSLSPFIEFTTIEITGDTIINGQACLIVEGGCNCELSATNFLYEDSNKIYRFMESSNDFHLLYDFTKAAGESWELYLDATLGTVTVTVDSIAPVINGNFPVYCQYITVEDFVDFGSYIIPGIGGNLCLFPQGNICDPQTGTIRCFQESNGTLYTANAAIACDSIIPLPSANIELENDLYQIYPNPFTDFLHIEFQNQHEFETVEVYSTEGRFLQRQALDQANAVNINLGNLVDGVYILRALGKAGNLTKKIIKQ